MERATKEALKTPGRIKTDTHEIPGVGEVEFRGLNRGEVLMANKIGDEKGQAAQEQYILSCVMVDPLMTQQDVAEWQCAAHGGEIVPIQKKINVLSKLGKDAAKSDVPSDGAGPVD